MTTKHQAADSLRIVRLFAFTVETRGRALTRPCTLSLRGG